MGEKVQGLKSTHWSVQNRQGDVKNSIGNGIAKELIYVARNGVLDGRGAKGEIWGQL